jgi:hypothetical protein
VDHGVLTGGDGRHERGRARGDRPSAIGRDLDYRLTNDGARLPRTRAVRLTDDGRAGLAEQFGVDSL